MNPDDPALPSRPPTLAAPARSVRLAAKRVEPLSELPLLAKKAGQAVDPLKAGSLERKLSGMTDAGEMLRVMSTELALQRQAREHHGGGRSRQALRVLSVTALFGLLIAALAAMGWMQSRLAEKGISRHPKTEATQSP